MIENTEQWKSIPFYEGTYEYSNLGNIKSLDRLVKRSGSSDMFLSGKHKVFILNNNGYVVTVLTKNNIDKTVRKNRLVWEWHNGTIPKNHEVHHKDEDKLNNDISNLICTPKRQHMGSHKKHKTENNYVGSHFNKKLNKWQSYIYFNKKLIHLGFYDTELNAHITYKNALKNLNLGIDLFDIYKPKGNISGIKGVYPTQENRWRARIIYNGKRIQLGNFDFKEDAKLAIDNYRLIVTQ